MTLDTEPMYCAEQINIPDNLGEILKAYAKEVIRQQPGNIYEFSARYFAQVRRRRWPESGRGPLVAPALALRRRRSARCRRPRARAAGHALCARPLTPPAVLLLCAPSSWTSKRTTLSTRATQRSRVKSCTDWSWSVRRSAGTTWKSASCASYASSLACRWGQHLGFSS